jgi:hypothetical protein
MNMKTVFWIILAIIALLIAGYGEPAFEDEEPKVEEIELVTT